MDTDTLLINVTVLSPHSTNFALCRDNNSEYRISSYKYSERHKINSSEWEQNQQITFFVNDKLLYNISGNLTVRLEAVSSKGRIYDRMPPTDVEVISNEFHNLKKVKSFAFTF
jgi:hypothetical protein